MTAAAIAFFLKHWKWFALGGIILLLGIQSARLSHAKADQFDHTACVKGQPCKPVKWMAEVATLKPALAQARSDLGTCKANVTTLEGSVAAQNAAVDALAKQGATRVAEVAKARQATRREADRADHAARLLADVKPVGNDLCERLLDADRKVKAAVE